MKSIRLLLLALLGALALIPAVLNAGDHRHGAQATDLTVPQRKFLSNYEDVRAALAADDLEAAKRSAAKISESQAAMQLSRAPTLNAARVAFKKMSSEALRIAEDRAGYFVAHCPMALSDWLEVTTKISNPYLGRRMSNCGTIKK